MASFCIDEDMSTRIADVLRASGQDAVSAKREGTLRGQGDETILLRAALEGRLLVTHNERHFKLLHRAWRRWPLTQSHAGILVVPQRYALSDGAVAEELAHFVRSVTDAANRLFLLQQRPPGGLSYAWEEWIT